MGEESNCISLPAYTAESGQIYEAIKLKGHLTFLTCKDGTFSTEDEIWNEATETTIRPLTKAKYIDYEFEDLPTRIPTASELYDKVYEQFTLFLDQKEEYRDILTVTCLVSYIQDFSETMPCICISGNVLTGKTVACKMSAQLGYRGYLTGDVTSANIYRFLDAFQKRNPGLLIEDEDQGMDSDRKKVKIYKMGTDQGASISRYNKDYNNFGLKIFSGEDIIHDSGLLRRSISMNFISGTPKKDLNQTLSEEPRHFFSLRKDLLVWRIAGVVKREKFNLPNPKDMRIFGQPLGELKDKWSPLLKMVTLAQEQNQRYEQEKANRGEESKTPRALRSISNALLEDFKTIYRNKADTWEGRIAKILMTRGTEFTLPDPNNRGVTIAMIKIEFSTLWEALAVSDGVQASGDDGHGTPSRLILLEQPDATQISVSRILTVKFHGVKKRSADELTYRFNKSELEKATKEYLVWEKIKEDGE
jgi:hypothetical protein